MKTLAKQATKYQNIPLTPPQRQHRMDIALQQPQAKLELAMNALVHHVETDDKQALLHTAAWIRSAWEDLHQQRRHTLAGKLSYKLEKRTDDNRPKLLTAEEENKIAQTKARTQPRPVRYWGDTTAGDNRTSGYKGRNWSWKPTENQKTGSKYPPKTSGKGKGKSTGKGL